MTAADLSGRDVVKDYIERGFKIVVWPDKDDWKGPREKNWIEKPYGLDDYKDGYRVGIMHGVLLNDVPGKHLNDVDIDWAPGIEIAKALLPATGFIWGREGKRISHCWYTTPDVIPMYAYKDIDGKTLIEFRSDKHQAMAPPSWWQKDGVREQLRFVVNGEPAHVESASFLQQRVCLSAIGMILSIHLGLRGFDHEARLAWAGFMLRAGIGEEDLQKMGTAMVRHCQNSDAEDISRVLASTRINLQRGDKKVKGGPALAKQLGEHGDEVIARINEWIGRDSDFARNEKGLINVRSRANIARALDLLGYRLSYDEFSERLLVNGHAMKDFDISEMWFKIDEAFRFMPPIDFFRQTVEYLAWTTPFHPVKDYLHKLAWDGVSRVDTWLIEAAGAEDTPYTRAVSSIFLIAAVRRILHPGSKYDEMLVLEGEQGTGKSSALQALCPNPEWFSDDLPLNVKSQQLIEATLGKWIIESSDMHGRSKAELDQLKAMLSRQVDGPVRLAYAHMPIERPRHFVIAGTTNSIAYLPDPTGNRRFWPVVAPKVNVAWIVENRDQLWAEAAVREETGETTRLPEELWPHAADEQEKRQEVDPWENIIRNFLISSVEVSHSDNKRRITVEAIWGFLNIDPDRRDRAGARRITDIMQRLGFRRAAVRISGEPVQRGFVQINDRLTREVAEDDPEVQTTGLRLVEKPPSDEDVPF